MTALPAWPVLPVPLTARPVAEFHAGSRSISPSPASPVARRRLTGDAPNCGPRVMQEAYSHEVSSAGDWPGPGGEGVFCSYAYPEPDGYRTHPIAPAEARYDEALGESVLPYEVIRTAADPDAVLLEFLHSTSAAAADTAAWNRDGLEQDSRVATAPSHRDARRPTGPPE